MRFIEHIRFSGTPEKGPHEANCFILKLCTALELATVHGKEGEKAFGHAFPMWGLTPLPRIAKSTRKIYTTQNLEMMKAYAETSGVEEFDSTKHRITGRKGKVSDRDLLNFLNGRKPSNGL